MKNCEICGAQLDDTATVCPVCGANVGAGQPAYTNAQAGGYNMAQESGQPNMQDQAYGVPQQPYDMGQSPYGQAPMPQQAPKKKTNVAAIVIIAVVAVAIIGFAVWFFLLRDSKGSNTPESVIETYLDALCDGDVDRLYSLWPEEMHSDEEYEQLESMLSMFKSYNIKVENLKIEDKTKLDSDEISDIEDEIKDGYGKSLKISEAYELDYSYDMSMEFMGESYSEPTSETSTVIKIGSKWYMYE